MAKEIIAITVKAAKADLIKAKTDLLAVGVFSDDKRTSNLCEELDERLGGSIARVRKLGDFKAKSETSVLLYGNEKIGAGRLLLVGLGERKSTTVDTFRKAAALAASKAVSLKAQTASFALHQPIGRQISSETLGQALAEGVHFGGYRYDEFVTNGENGRLKSLDVTIVDSNSARVKCQMRGITVGNVIGGAQSLARTIANRPGNVLNPGALAKAAERTAQETPGLGCTVFDEKQLKAKKMGGILAVGSGSRNKPRFIVLKYTPSGRITSKAPIIGLVGKAITFDSGGISIKPAKGMGDMKMDVSGGAAVLATMKAIAELKVPVKVYGIIPAAENMPGGGSYRPGDIVTTYSGKTVEVQNTDAEGRMVLCDGLHYAVEQKCEVIVDIATLTGACKVALGRYKAGLMSNDEGLKRQLETASQSSGESLWHMPSGAEYLEEMKSKIADLKNTGSKWGGACTGAAFLGEFVGEAKWAHIDMAGVDILGGANKSDGVGSTGFGVRVLITYVMNIAKNR